jgi:hypothetical protein
VIAASDVPLWAAIVIGFGSGLAGTVTRIAYERTAELRSRMITGADDFSTAAADALAAVNAGVRTLAEDLRGLTERFSAAQEHASDKVVLADARVNRVYLLFGVAAESRAALAAFDLMQQLNLENALMLSLPGSVDPLAARDDQVISV